MTAIPGKVIATSLPSRHHGHSEVLMTTASAQQTSAFGRQLKLWRRQHGLSQLELANAAQLSQRYVSFIETGRSRPGEAVVLRVGEALDLPLRARNTLLLAAGLAPLFPVVEDGPTNAVDTFLRPGPVRDMIENFDDVAWIFLQRLRHEVASSGPDPQLHALLERAESYLSDITPSASASADAGADLVICPRLRIGDQIVATLSMIARFGNTQEVNLDELRVELIFPADPAAESFFHELANRSI
jgi:transcriptional regulator with XRE-family HTH domain